MKKMTNKFEANGKFWMTDDQTIELMRQYKNDGNEQMVAAVFELGRSFGRIVEA